MITPTKPAKVAAGVAAIYGYRSRAIHAAHWCLAYVEAPSTYAIDPPMRMHWHMTMTPTYQDFINHRKALNHEH